MRYLALIPLIFTGLITGCLDRGDSDQSAPVVDSTVTPNSFLTFVNQGLDIDSDAYADAYYQAVDPMNERTTLADWKSVNGFDGATDVVHVTFRDTKDLGYGRDMYAREFPDGRVAVYVDNYVVRIEPGDATSYGPLNLDAAIEQDREYHFGTNAIEFSPDPNDPNAQKILKFFTFSPSDGKGAVQRRLTAADLDGRGVKHMPTMCVICHGATMYPLRQDGSFDPVSLKSPKLNILQQHTLQFSAEAGFTEADQKDGIAAINRMVYNTYRETGMRADRDGNNNTVNDDRDDEQANWLSDFAEELVEGAYGDTNPGDDVLEQNTDYQADVIPSGWSQTADRPGGVEVLYKQVIEPHCIGCHSLRGTRVAQANDKALNPEQYPNAVNFSSYEEFIGLKDLIIDYVYRRGAMPRSLINFSQFWNDPDDAPTLLATYLDGFDVFDANGNVVMPGKSVAIPGADRTVALTPVILSASASMFSVTYSWRIVSSTDPNAVLNDPSSSAPVFTAADGAEVVLELTTSNAMGNSEPAQVTIKVDSAFTPSAPTFVSDIQQLLIDATCASCHSASPACGTNSCQGIPVYYDEGSYSDKKDLYRNVLNRVDLNDPENSLLLRKPASLQHGGSTVLGIGDNNYLALLNWIRDGAPCGNDLTFCDP